jgi:hypothetical protein
VKKKEIRCVLRWMNDIKLDLEENGWKRWASVIRGKPRPNLQGYSAEYGEERYILT